MSSKLAEFKNQDSDRAKVEKWLDHINEHDPACRTEVLTQCSNDRDARAYYVGRYKSDYTAPNTEKMVADMLKVKE